MKFGQLDTWKEVNFSFPKLSKKTKTYLSVLDKVAKPNFFIGAPVFSDKNYKGTLFPVETRQKDFLQAYGKQFNSI